MGREMKNPVRRYYSYDCDRDVSQCCISGCNKLIKGNHAANLERHVSRLHPFEHVNLMKMKQHIAAEQSASQFFYVPQPPPAQKPLQPPQPQTQKVLPPQQVTAPKPIAPKPSPVAQPVSPIQPLPPPPEVCLRWNSYHSNMQATFPSLLNNEQFVDVTLACEGRSIKCHKMMLSACSAYFEELLSQNPCQHPIVLMKDLRYWEVQALVDFMYRGEVNVGQDKLPSLLAAAEALQIKGLAGPAFSSNDDDNSQPTPVNATEDYIDEPAQSPSSSRRAKRRRVMSSTLTPRVQSTPSQAVQSSPKATSISGKRSVKPVSVPSTSSNFALESPSVPTEPPSRRARKSETDLVGQIKIEPIDIEINNDSMDDMEDSFLDKPYDDADLGEESNCLSNDPGGTDNSKNLDLGDTMKTLHGHEADNLDYGTNNSTSGSDQNFKYDDSGSQDDGLISDIPGTSYQDSLIQPSSSGMSNSNSNVNDSLLGHM